MEYPSEETLMLALLLSLLISCQDAHIITKHYAFGRAYNCTDRWDGEPMVEIVDKFQNPIFTVNPNSLHRWYDIKPDGFDVTKIRDGAHIKIVRYRSLNISISEAPRDEVIITDNFDDEYMEVANAEFVYKLTKAKPGEGLTKSQQSIYYGLSHNRYSIRQTCRDKLLKNKDFKVYVWAKHSADAEVRALAEEVWFRWLNPPVLIYP